MDNKERRAFFLPGIPVFVVLLAVLIALFGVLIWYTINVLGGMGEGARRCSR